MYSSYQIANCMRKYEFLDDVADVAFKAYGKDINEVFENAAEALESIMISLEDVALKEALAIEIASDTYEDLLYDWLSELLVTFEIESFAIRQCRVTIRGFSLTAECLGDRIDQSKHRLKEEVKAITYHNLEVTKNDHYHAQVTVDV